MMVLGKFVRMLRFGASLRSVLVIAGFACLLPQRMIASDWLIEPTGFVAKVQTIEAERELVLTNGLLTRRFRIQPNLATVDLKNQQSGETLLRGIKPEARITIDGKSWDIGGLVGQRNYAFLDPAVFSSLQTDPQAFQFVGHAVRDIQERMPWKQIRPHAPDVAWPPRGVELRFDFVMPKTENSDLAVSVHYELYDGLPCYGKWISITNRSAKEVRLDRYQSDLLAAIEHTSEVDALSIGLTPPNLHVETEMAMGGMTSQGANRRSYRWVADPQYASQVNYEKKTPCLLEVGPDLGPGISIRPGDRWESYRGWVLAHDSTDRERCGLAVRKMFRTLAPWVTENPLMMHLIASDDASVKRAIDQCHEVGFEMLILSFGSGFNLESRNPEVLKKAQSFSAYAAEKEIEIGSYSLLASRSVNKESDVVPPPGEKPVFGNSPCLGSEWGKQYFDRLYEFHLESGFRLLEHDGSYPGDPCASHNHPGHHDLQDSRWNQWQQISTFYRWCRGQGLFLNVPDHYFMAGSNKTGMGYREVNWSLPREEQTIHTRQNIFDGTWQKTPSMGWMFVPLTEYHGGGPKATIEPLDQNIDHYRNMIQSNLALGVQACYRGPRLYDTDRVKDTVKAQVDWYKAHREILESDLIHGRRADAKSLDWMLHANPKLKEKGLVAIFNPTGTEMTETLRIPLYYTGIREKTAVVDAAGNRTILPLDRKDSVELRATVAPHAIRAAAKR